MSVKELKSEFHKLIDNIDDETLLYNFYEAIRDYKDKNKKVDIIDELTEKQRERLFDSIEQVSEGKTKRHDEVKEELRKWLLK